VAGASTGGVLCAGNIVLDLLTRPVDEVRWDATTWVESIEQSLGGNGANTSYTLAKLGTRVRLLGTAGSDAFGDAALAALASAGVDLSQVNRTQAPTATTVVLVRSDGARALLHRPGASAQAFAQLPVFTPDVVARCRRFHLANFFGLPKLRPQAGVLLQSARAAGLMTSMDTGWDAKDQWLEIAEPCLPHLDLLFVNEDEARLLTSVDDPDGAARFFLGRGVGIVVVKLGPRGCMVRTQETSFRSPAFAVQCVDTTGAGDCFVGGFLAALESGESLEAAARWGNAAGALSVQRLGSTTGILSRSETLSWMAGR
jgi:sugar/nucleoside kinase (ribokinase family)